MASDLYTTSLDRFRLISYMEGMSFLVLLFVAMPLKYGFKMPEAVKVAGMVHGVLFILYLFLLITATLDNKWSFKNVILLFLASILPFGFLAAEALFLKKQSKNTTA